MNDLVFKRSRIQPSGTIKPLARSDPQLPRPLWERFKREFPESIIFTNFFSDIRHIMLVQGPTPDLTAAIPVHLNAAMKVFSIDASKAGQGLSYLHLATLQGDLPLAYESLRLGTSIHCKDEQGYSPLFFGTRMLSRLMHHGKSNFPVGPLSLAEGEEQIFRRRDVCLFLISNHSDPNETHMMGGTTISVLALACCIGSWELINALLLHGANPTGLAKIFQSKADRNRFKTLASEMSTAVRPLRICPCGSGRSLKDCHLEAQPYPPSYICPCESRKIHSACCAKEPDVSWEEIWDEEKGWLDPRPCITRNIQTADPDTDGTDIKLGMLVAGMAGMGGAAFTRQTFPWLEKSNLVILQALAEQRRIDPAFVAASKKTMLTPSPTAIRAVPKPKWMKAMAEWNEAVDAYIASGVDKRASGVIEAAAKIGLAGGPLYRKCEAARCANMESSNSAKVFSHCGGCKTAVYCSRSCQKSAWQAHKSACRAEDVETQLLPSQEAYAAELARIVGFKFK
ncbi:hypothetical protein FB451DRAFT_1268301 [Mycena latifolia]|nr:hypothetical protein FB451DRAFT_1268301 [Mycena latifolia]